MSKTIHRRDFLKSSANVCLGCSALMLFPKIIANENSNFGLSTDEHLNPKLLNYCGYQCPADCKFLKASLENDAELKKEAYELWKIKERYGAEFDADKLFCFGCKTKDKPIGIVLQNCTVRSCAIEKGYDCCIECKELEDCQKELWNNFPDFKKTVIGMQTKYFEAVSVK
jgi:hypothetical protein